MNKTIKVSFTELYPLIKNAIENGNSFSFVAFGNSMSPFICGGKDKVTLSPIKTPLRKGDIIFYKRSSGIFVLHRITKICGDCFELCGDNQFRIEKGIHFNQIIGVLTDIERNNKKINLGSMSAKLWIAYLPLRRFFKTFIYLCKRITKKLLHFFKK